MLDPATILSEIKRIREANPVGVASIEFENEIGNSRAIEFLSFEAPIETALRLEKAARGGPTRASSTSIRGRQKSTLAAARRRPAWRGGNKAATARADRPYARTRKDITDNHTKFSSPGASWGCARSRSPARGFRTIQVCPQDLPPPLRYAEHAANGPREPSAVRARCE